MPALFVARVSSSIFCLPSLLSSVDMVWGVSGKSMLAVVQSPPHSSFVISLNITPPSISQQLSTPARYWSIDALIIRTTVSLNVQLSHGLPFFLALCPASSCAATSTAEVHVSKCSGLWMLGLLCVAILCRYLHAGARPPMSGRAPVCMLLRTPGHLATYWHGRRRGMHISIWQPSAGTVGILLRQVN